MISSNEMYFSFYTHPAATNIFQTVVTHINLPITMCNIIINCVHTLNSFQCRLLELRTVPSAVTAVSDMCIL